MEYEKPEPDTVEINPGRKCQRGPVYGKRIEKCVRNRFLGPKLLFIGRDRNIVPDELKDEEDSRQGRGEPEE